MRTVASWMHHSACREELLQAVRAERVARGDEKKKAQAAKQIQVPAYPMQKHNRANIGAVLRQALPDCVKYIV